MANMKFLVCLVSLVVIVSATEKETRLEHNYKECRPTSGAGKSWTSFVSKTIEASGHFLQITERVLTWPTDGSSYGKIKCIRVTDVKADGTGGYPTITDGGIDHNEVTIRMVSQRSRGFIFHIEILGEPEV